MLEIPEAVVIAGQIDRTLADKHIDQVIANQTPHKFAWFTGDPARYPELLGGKSITGAQYCGGYVEVHVDEMLLVFSTSMHYYPAGEKLPAKHQLSLRFTDGSFFIAVVQMWGGLFCFKDGEKGGMADYQMAKEKPSILSEGFTREYFYTLIDEQTRKLPAKAFLATEQRISGLGNGVLQDILWNARIHPRTKLCDLSPQAVDGMFHAVKDTASAMVAGGGRDTEIDLFGKAGGYKTVLSKNTVGKPCPACGALIQKEAYMGGSVYFCPVCQK